MPKVLKIFKSVGMAHFGFIFLTANKLDKEIENHEYIHIRQQREMLIVFWYAFYILNFLYNFLIKYHVIFKFDMKKYFWKSYSDLILEKEAYMFENDNNYLKTRKFWNFARIKFKN